MVSNLRGGCGNQLFGIGSDAALNRVEKTFVFMNTPLRVEMVPFPSFKPLLQTALAVRCIRLSFDVG